MGEFKKNSSKELVLLNGSFSGDLTLTVSAIRVKPKGGMLAHTYCQKEIPVKR
jgi:hypothetical protein